MALGDRSWYHRELSANRILVFFFLFLPEVKGRTLEEIDELFQNKVSVLDFPKYDCMSGRRAREIASNIAPETIKSNAGSC